MAAMCEKTKPFNKVRETWSTDSIKREVTSEHDQAEIPLSQLLKGVVSRNQDSAISPIFDQIKDRKRLMLQPL